MPASSSASTSASQKAEPRWLALPVPLWERAGPGDREAGGLPAQLTLAPHVLVDAAVVVGRPAMVHPVDGVARRAVTSP